MKKLPILLIIGFISALLTTIFYYFNFPKISTTPDPASTFKFSGQKINFLVTIPQVRAARAIADWFNAETKAVVQITEIGYDETMTKTLGDTESPHPQYDVFTIWYPELGDLVQKGALSDLTEWIESNKAVLKPEDFIQSIYDPYTLQNGKRWAIPFDGDTHVLFYRKSLLEKHNLKPPATWDDYSNICRTITEKESKNGIYGCAIMGFKVPILILSSFLNRAGGYGGELFSAEGKPTLDSPEVYAALKAFIEHSNYALPTPLETNFEVSRDAFLSGRVAMVEQWTDIGVMAEDKSESSISGDWGVVQMPKGSGEKAHHAPALNAGYALGVSSKAPNPEIARAFLLFAARPDIMAKYNAINGGADPTRISVLTSANYRSFAPLVSEAAQASLKDATAWPTIPGSSALMEVLSANLVLALEKRKSPKKALQDTQKKWIEILDSTK